MMYYSFLDLQVSRILSSGRNSTNLDDLVAWKLEYHSDLEEDISKMYDLNSLEGKLQCCFDFEFTIIKHERKFPEDDFDDTTKNWGEINYDSLTFEEAKKEFGGKIIA